MRSFDVTKILNFKVNKFLKRFAKSMDLSAGIPGEGEVFVRTIN